MDAKEKSKSLPIEGKGATIAHGPKMKSEANGTGEVWKMISAALASIVVTGTTAWFLFAANSMSRSEVSDFIRSSSPYAQEREYVRSMLTKHDALIDRNSESVGKFRTDLVAISAKIDLLLQNVQRIQKIDGN